MSPPDPKTVNLGQMYAELLMRTQTLVLKLKQMESHAAYQRVFKVFADQGLTYQGPTWDNEVTLLLGTAQLHAKTFEAAKRETTTEVLPDENPEQLELALGLRDEKSVRPEETGSVEIQPGSHN